MSKKLEIDYDEYQDMVRTVIKQKEVIDKWLNSGKTLIFERSSKCIRFRDINGKPNFANIPVIREYPNKELHEDLKHYINLWEKGAEDCENLIKSIREKTKKKSFWCW